MSHTQSEQIVKAVWSGVITEEEACELSIAIKHGDTEAIERLRREHECTDK